MKIKRYKGFVSESMSDESFGIDDYIIHLEDIKEIFSELYDDIPLLENSQVKMKDITNNNHPSIRSSTNNIPYAKSQFEVVFFLPSELTDTDTDWWGRFYQPFPRPKGQIRRHFRTGDILPEEEDKVYKPLNDKLILESISNKMNIKYGYELTKMSMGGGNGYWLFFYFSKNN